MEKSQLSTTERLSHRWSLAGTIILVVGLLLGPIVYFRAPSAAEDDTVTYQTVNGKTYATPADASSRELQQIERLGGTAAVLTFKFNRWFASLWAGERLAYSLIVIAAALAWLCFHVAGLIAEEANDHAEIDPRDE